MSIFSAPRVAGTHPKPLYVFVGHDVSANLDEFRGDSGALLTTSALPQKAFHGCWDGNSLWVVDSLAAPNNAVYKINPATLAVLLTLSPAWGVSSAPTGICTDGSYVYISVHNGGGNGKLFQYDLAGAPGWNVAVGDNPYVPCYDPDNACIWAPNYVSGTVAKVLIATGGVVGFYATTANPFVACFANGHIWISCRGTNSVRKLVAATGALVGDYATGNNPIGVVYDGTYIYVANRNDGTITKLVEATGAFVATYPTGYGAGELYFSGFDGTYLWLTLATSNLVMRMRASDGSIASAVASSAAAPLGAVVSTARVLPWPLV